MDNTGHSITTCHPSNTASMKSDHLRVAAFNHQQGHESEIRESRKSQEREWGFFAGQMLLYLETILLNTEAATRVVETSHTGSITPGKKEQELF